MPLTYGRQTMKTKQKFNTPEAYILGQKYNVLNRKARKIQGLVAEGCKVMDVGGGIFVLVNTGPEVTVTTSVSGPMFAPYVHTKTEASYKG